VSPERRRRILIWTVIALGLVVIAMVGLTSGCGPVPAVQETPADAVLMEYLREQ
jgi:hypothetical protein